MDKKTVLKNVKSLVTGYSHDPYDDSYDDSYESFSEWDDKLKLRDLDTKLIERKGGEGEGDHYHLVFEISDSSDSMYVMVVGFYSSYEGVDWSDADVSEVVPYEKTVKAWKTV